jgi:hypothetical protein
MRNEQLGIRSDKLLLLAHIRFTHLGIRSG